MVQPSTTPDRDQQRLDWTRAALADPSVGLERTATLIRQARAEFPNNLLVDNGDTIQGSVLGTYEAQVAPIPPTQQLTMY